MTLVPFFVPSLRGELAVYCCGDGTAKAMIDLFGEVQFRHTNLVGHGIQHLVYACPSTLETLTLDAVDICGENPPPKDTRALVNAFTGTYAPDLDLSRNKSLRTLEITAESLIGELRDRSPATTPSCFKAMVSTISSPIFSDVVILYQQGDYYNNVYSEDMRVESWDEETWYHKQFEVFRAMYEARDYRLVLSVDQVGGELMQELERALTVEWTKGGLPAQVAIHQTLPAC